MNRHIHLLYIGVCFCMALLSACKDEVPGNVYQPALEAKSLSITPQSLKAKAIGETLKIEVRSTNMAWKFTDVVDKWIMLSPMNGRETTNVQLTVAENLDPTTGRTTVWKFTDDEPDYNRSCTMSLTQDAPGYYVIPEETQIEIGASAATRGIYVFANAQWTATSGQSWVTCSTNESTLTLNIEENTTTFDKDREATVTITCGNSKAYVTVRQHPANITATTETLVYSNIGGTYSLNVESDVSWTASTSQSWLSVDPESAPAGKRSLYITSSPNISATERTANVYIKVGTKQMYQIPVRQQKSYVTLDKSLLEYGIKESSQNITVSSNTEWQVISTPDFVTITPTGMQQDNKDLQIFVSANKGEKREGDVVIGVPNVTGLQQTVHIVQEGAYMQATSFSVSLGSVKDSQHKITLNTNDDWTAHMLYGDWAKVSPKEGSGVAEITITVDDNPTLKERVDTLIVDGSLTNGLRVATVQKGRYLNVNKGAIWFFENKKEDLLTITTDASYIVNCTVDWAKVTQNDNVIMITVEELPEGGQRDGTIEITMTGLMEGEYKITIPIYQRKGTTFNITSFTTDESWDLAKDQHIEIKVEGFGGDDNWNPKDNNSAKIDVTTFGNDNNWNSKDNDVNVDVTTFGNDNNWNSQNNIVNAHVITFGNDNNWNK